ncbi:hypothetical protein PIB30_102008 [Stylosanthes scabra]|uniref:Secreted protein n=1 Tax=Stylosanthes scabra TaxID=79078 RepID=A0ABU6ZX36_9FABA|nr:hypothetical protein [Stylosanthes scabra]
MHMLAVLRICVALEWASKDGVTFSSSNAWRSLGHVWAWLDVILDRDLCELSTHMRGLPLLCVGLVKLLAAKVGELADPPRICVVFYAYECKGWAWSPRLSVTELLRRGFDLM